MIDHNQEVFMSFLQSNFPYLYDIEMEVLKVADRTGFGDVSFSLKIWEGRVVSGEILGAAKKKYLEKNEKNDRNLF